MKGYRRALRAMIVAGSVTGFFSGWVMLAHTVVSQPATTKQAAAAVAATDPQPQSQPQLPPLDLKALAPEGDVQSVIQVPSQPSQTSRQALPVLPAQPSQGFIPRLRTGGS